MEFPDHEAHLRAIHGLAQTLKAWNQEFDKETKEAALRNPRDENEVEDIISIYYHAGFADLATSHAFVCTIAAFLESLFKSNLPAAGRAFRGKLPDSDNRVRRFTTNPDSFWDPRKPEREGSVVSRVCEILKTSGLGPYFGADYERCLSAIFEYRNYMVHNGYEWDLNRRRDFKAKIEQNQWGAWFGVATSGSDPWFFTTTPAFQETCLTFCARSVRAFDGLTMDDWDRYRFHYEPRVQSAGEIT